MSTDRAKIFEDVRPFPRTSIRLHANPQSAIRNPQSLSVVADLFAGQPTGVIVARMLATLVMTVIGADRPGLVQMVAARVADHGGNWLESRMCRLGGQFAGILRVEVPEDREEELVSSLRTLEADGLNVIIHPERGGVTRASEGKDGAFVMVELVGTDRPGILRSVSGVFAEHGVNVEELASERINAPMDGGVLFKARATVFVPTAVRLATVRADLEKIAADLMVDVKLVPVEGGKG